MYILDTKVFTIILIVVFVFHMILHIIEFIKIHNLKTNKAPLTFSAFKAKAKELFTTLLKPEHSIISGIKEFIFNSIHSQKKEDDSEDNEDKNG